MKDSESSLEEVLDLRMKPSVVNADKTENLYENISFDQIKSLISQDRSYYGISSGTMNAAYREKMAQWEYRIVDHFGLSRDLVGISFSILDRFTSKCACDRRAYKLATMTSLFVAMKLHNPRRFSIDALATLSRGEFNTSHIAQMEWIILKTLDWRLSPPTVQSFIYVWGNHFFKGPCATDSIDRARFLAEIAVFDTLLASKERALLAIAALADTVEGWDRYGPSGQLEITILRKLKTDFGIHYAPEEIYSIQKRLCYIYSKTSQCLADKCNQSDADMEPYYCKNNVNKMEHEESVSNYRNTIKTKYFQSPRSVQTRCERA